jgi:ribosomal protein S18 acetylase RimI-like enzyme
MPVHVRRATEADADALVAANLALAVETEDRRLDAGRVAAGVRRVLRDAALGVYYVAEDGGRIVGQLLITREFSDWRNGWFWWIQSVYVSPTDRRRGVYRALHASVIAAARADGDVCGVRLYVDRANTGAQVTYQSLGMRRTEYDLYEIDWSL